MTKRSREILAVILLFILVCAGTVAIAAYMATGRSWNVAATRIDDSVGNMSGYTVFVYKGALQPVLLDAEVDSEEEGEDPLESSLLEENENQAGHSFAAAVLSATSSSSSSSASNLSNLLIQVVSDYRDKEAEVFALDSDNLDSYAQPLIIERNGSRIGIFSVNDSTTTIGIDRVMNYFTEHEVDYTIVLDSITPTDEEIAENAESASSASSSSSSENASSNDESSDSSSSSSSSASSAAQSKTITVNDYLISSTKVDVVIDFKRSWYGTLGVNRDGKFLVSSPENGEVGLVMVSPSGVVSAKVEAQD